MSQFAVVENGVVTNIVLWDGVSDWSPESGECVAIPDGVFVSIGSEYDGSQFVIPVVPGSSWDDIRRERDRRLTASDWTQVADAPVDADVWMVYRQELRDIPETFASPDDVVWPVPPS